MNIGAQRLRSQRLIGPRFKQPGDVVRWFGAMQSQDFPAAKWGVALRMDGTTDAALDDAFRAGAFLRLHALRPTWHFLAPDDLRWVLELTSPRVHAANARVYQRHELDGAVLKRARAFIIKALRDRQYRARAELGALLEAKRIPANGQRLAYLLMHCELDGVICSGPLRGGKHTYALVEERVPPAPRKSREEALAELARRYFTSHGPATAHDFAWWSGLTVREARVAAGLAADELETVTLADRLYWFAAHRAVSRAGSPIMHLLPNYDEHLVAYRDHAPSLDPRAPDALRNWGNALTSHMVARNGLVVGGWRRSIEDDRVAIQLNLLAPLKPAEQRALDRAVADYGKFMGRQAVIERGKD